MALLSLPHAVRWQAFCAGRQRKVRGVSIQAGQTCPTCERRVPHPKKASSPKTATVSYRAPIGELEAHRETLETVAVYLGVRERPHHIFWTVVYALARVLQDPEMKDVAARGGW